MKINVVLALIITLLTSCFTQAQNCHVVITNPKLGNAQLSNLCLDFGDTATAQTLAGMCRPEWNGMNVTSQTVAVCPRATQGACRHTLDLGGRKHQYIAHYYSTPYTTTDDNRKMCEGGGGEWLVK